jgi:hypothetical protein
LNKNALRILLFLLLSTTALARTSMKSRETPHPLSFDVIGHGVETPSMEFEYKMEGDELTLGDLKLTPENFFVKLLPAHRMDARLNKALATENLKDWVFLFQWPEHLMSEGVLEVISRTGHSLWKMDLDSRTLEVWENQLAAWQKEMIRAKIPKEEIAKAAVFRIQYGLRQAETLTPFWNLDENFHFCFSKVEGSGQTRLCTPPYQVVKGKNGLSLALVPRTPEPGRVILMNQPAKLADSFSAPENKSIQFYAELPSGMSYEFFATPEKIHIVDMVEDPRNPEFAFITIEGKTPLAEATLLNKEKTPEWVEWVGWQQTIGDFRQYWRARIPVKNSYLMVSGQGGGAFKQRFDIQQLPTEKMRPYLNVRTPKATYIDGPPVTGKKMKDVALSSTQNSVNFDEEVFVWSFGANKRGQMNRSSLLVQSGANTFPAYLEMYKGYPRELSARLSGVIGTEGTFTIMNELAFNYWYEDLFGWTNYWAGRQRWGTSLKAFRSLSNIKISSKDEKLQTYTAEIKYRLDPGLWGRDETWGLIAGYQKVSYDYFQADMVGPGFFWARSMPQIFDNLINLIPYLNYPKWVDLEFIYYMMSLTPDAQLGRAQAGNWSLNFHGQILFTDQFFGEAGFGIKQYDYSHAFNNVRIRDQNFTFTSFYGTAGLGFKF